MTSIKKLYQCWSQGGGSGTRTAHCLHLVSAPCRRLAGSPALKGLVVRAGGDRLAGGNPGSSIPSRTAVHNDPLLDSRVGGPGTRCQPPAIHERTRHCQGENKEASIKQQISWSLTRENISDCRSLITLKKKKKNLLQWCHLCSNGNATFI